MIRMVLESRFKIEIDRPFDLYSRLDDCEEDEVTLHSRRLLPTIPRPSPPFWQHGPLNRRTAMRHHVVCILSNRFACSYAVAYG